MAAVDNEDKSVAISSSDWFEGSRFGSFQFKAFLACLILNTMEGYDLFVYGAALPVLMPALKLSAAQAGTVASAASLGTLFGALIFGPMADKVGRKRIILISAALSCLSMLLAGLSHDFTTFALSRFAFGIANGGMVVNIMALISEYVPNKSRATTVGLIASGSSIGGLVGALLGIFTFDLYGWRPVFIGSSFLIFLFPLYLRWLPEGTGFLVRNGRADELRRYMRLARPNEILADEVEIVTAPGKNKVPVGEVFSDGRTRGVLLFWVCYLCNLFVIHGFNSWLPKLMVNRGFKLEQGLSFLLPVSIASIVMTFLIGRITDRVGAKPVLVVLYLLSSSAIFLVGMSHDYVVLMFLCGLAGVGFNGAQNMMNGYSPTYFPPPIRSTATGYNFVLGRFGGVAGPLVVGLLISAAWSFNDTMIALAIPSVIAAVAIASIPEKFGFAARKKHAEVAAVA